MYDMEAALDVQENSEAIRSAAVGALFEVHGRDVYRFVSRRLRGAMAQDVTAEAFRIVFERWDQYSPALGSERAWLFGVASNVIRRHLRTEQRRFSALSGSQRSSTCHPRMESTRTTGLIVPMRLAESWPR